MTLEELVSYVLANRYIASCLPQFAEFWDDDKEN